MRNFFDRFFINSYALINPTQSSRTWIETRVFLKKIKKLSMRSTFGRELQACICTTSKQYFIHEGRVTWLKIYSTNAASVEYFCQK